MTSKIEGNWKLGKIKYQGITNKIVNALEVLDRNFHDDQEFSMIVTKDLSDTPFIRERCFRVTIKPIGRNEVRNYSQDEVLP